MKAKIIIPLLSVVAGSLMSACGGDGGGSPSASQSPQPQALDTAEVLAEARVTSETSEPYAVDDGALTLTDTSETSEPINVNLM
jgi:hypothetical protein